MSRDVLDSKSWPETTSTAGPAAAQSPGGRPVLAWRGDHNSRNLTLAVLDGPPGSIGQSYLATYGCDDASDHAPALTYHRGLRLAWAGGALRPARVRQRRHPGLGGLSRTQPGRRHERLAG